MTSKFRFLAWLLSPALLLLAPVGPHAATLTVTTTSDADNAADGHCSLREAITALNAGANRNECTGTGFGNNDRIVFNIAGSGVKTIALNTELPVVNRQVTIDGLTQPGASCDAWPPTLLVELDGLGARGRALRFEGASGGSVVRGLVLGGVNSTVNFSSAVELWTDGNRIECNYFGMRPDGTTPNPNRHGVVITSSNDNIIGTNGIQPALGRRNLVASSVVSGIHTRGVAPSRNIIAGNYIGVDATGMESRTNNRGVIIAAVASTGPAADNVIGYGGAPAIPEFARNVISGNSRVGGAGGMGISMANNVQRTLVAGNYIGISADGTQAVPNYIGVQISNEDDVQHNMIGFPSDQPLAVSGNVISGNSFVGVQLSGSNGADNHYVVGNLIGTYPNGEPGLPNGTYAVQLSSGTSALINGNVISGHSEAGIRLLGSSTKPLPQMLNNVTLPTGHGPLDSSGNCITDNAVGFQITPNGSSLTTVTFEENWWGAANGPSGNGPGNGDSVSSPFVDYDPFLTSAPAGCAVTPVADLSVAVTGVPDPVVAGTTVIAGVEISNLGPDSAEAVVLRISPPAGYAPAPPPGCSLDAGDVVCAVGTIASNDDFSAALPLMVPPDATGGFSVTVSVSSATLDPVAGNNSVIVARSFASVHDLQVLVDTDAVEVRSGRPFEFQVRATNEGPSAANGALVDLMLPTGAGELLWTCTPTGGATCAPAGSATLVETVDLPSGAEAQFNASVLVGDVASLAVSALVVAPLDGTDPDAANNSDTLDVPVLEPLPPLIFRDGFEALE